MKSLMLLVEMSKPQNHCQMLQQSQLKTALHQSKYVLLKSENDLTQEQQLNRSNPTSFTALGADALLERRV